MIVGVSGKATSGKDTAAGVFEDFNFRRISFAEPIRNIARTVFGLSEGQLTNHILKETLDPRYGMSPRQILQAIGNKMREICPDIWLLYGIRRVVNRDNAGLHSVISDVRFPNELTAIQALGGIVIRIERQGAASETGADDISETALDGCDKFNLVINNDGSVHELRRKLRGLVESWGFTSKEAA